MICPFPRAGTAAVGLILLGAATPEVHAQSRSMQGRSFMTPAMMNTPTRFAMPAVTPMTMGMTFPMTPGFGMNVTTTNLLRHDPRFDSLLRRQLRFEEWRRWNWGSTSMIWPGSWWGTGAALGTIPVGGYPTGTTTAAAPAAAPADAAKSALLQEQATAERLANRRRAFDELRYERDKTPTPEEELLARSRNNPPQAEVLSGQSLNALLTDLRALSAGGGDDPFDALLPLDRKGLGHINVTRGAGDLSLLKDAVHIAWPAALSDTAYADLRGQLTARIAEVARQATENRRIDPDVVRQLAGDAALLRATFRQDVPGLSFESYGEAKTFLKRIDDAVVALQQPDAVDDFNAARGLRARTVLGLVKEMTDGGLRFAPAAAGDETAYMVLREALAACDQAGVRQRASR